MAAAGDPLGRMIGDAGEDVGDIHADVYSRSHK
jgi:hypothetical protein